MFSPSILDISQATASREYGVKIPYPLILESSDKNNLMDRAKVKETLEAVANYSFLLGCAADATEDYITDKTNVDFIKKAETAKKISDQAREHLGTVKMKTGITACHKELYGRC